MRSNEKDEFPYHVKSFGGASVAYWEKDEPNRWRKAAASSGYSTQVLLDVKARKSLQCWLCSDMISTGELYVAVMPMAGRHVERFHYNCWRRIFGRADLSFTYYTKNGGILNG